MGWIATVSSDGRSGLDGPGGVAVVLLLWICGVGNPASQQEPGKSQGRRHFRAYDTMLYDTGVLQQTENGVSHPYTVHPYTQLSPPLHFSD